MILRINVACWVMMLFSYLTCTPEMCWAYMNFVYFHQSQVKDLWSPSIQHGFGTLKLLLLHNHEEMSWFSMPNSCPLQILPIRTYTSLQSCFSLVESEEQITFFSTANTSSVFFLTADSKHVLLSSDSFVGKDKSHMV